jgi:hypothetical protein
MCHLKWAFGQIARKKVLVAVRSDAVVYRRYVLLDDDAVWCGPYEGQHGSERDNGVRRDVWHYEFAGLCSDDSPSGQGREFAGICAYPHSLLHAVEMSRWYFSTLSCE